MKPGVYRIVFSGFGEAAAGVAIVRGAELVGGDNNFYYSGRLRRDGERLFAEIEAVRHSAGPAPAFGPLSKVTLDLAGSTTDGVARLTGSARQMPAVSAAVSLSPIAPFEGQHIAPARPVQSPEPRAANRRAQDCPFEDDEDRRAGSPCARVGWLDKPMSDLQLRLLGALWSLGEAPAVELHEAITAERTVALSTIAHALADMERRRLISHRSQGARHLYRAEVVADQVIRSLAKSLTTVADTLYSGDQGALISQLMQAATASAATVPDQPPEPQGTRKETPRATLQSAEPGLRSRSR